MLEGALVSWATMAQESEAGVQRLRELLRDALVASEPRKEKDCWNALVDICSDQETFSHTLRWYTQDIVAALLYLGVENTKDLEQCAPHSAPVLTQSKSSIPYVSAEERRLASSLLCSIMLGRSFSDIATTRLIGGIFPLMGSSSSPSVSHEAPPLRASIARALFGHHRRFESKRTICGVLLDTLLFGRSDGLRGLLMAALLSDGIERGELVDAVQQIMPLLMRATPPTILDATTSGWVLRAMNLEDYHRSVCAQLLGLLGRVSEREAVNGAGRPTAPLQRGLQSSETIEERLHLFLATALNRIVHLPSPAAEPRAFQTAYRMFHSANKLLFGPGFGALAMHSPKETSAVEQAVSNLLCVIKGTSGCASHEAVLMLCEKCFPGLLAVTAVVLRALGASWSISTSPLVACLRSIWLSVSQMSLCYTEVAVVITNAFVRSDRKSVDARWRVADGGVCFEPTSDGSCAVTTGDELLAILRWHPAPKLIQAVFYGLCQSSQHLLFGERSKHADLHRLVGTVYTFLISLDIQVVLELDRLDRSIATLNIALTLGPLLFRTCVGLLKQLLASLTAASTVNKDDIVLSLGATRRLLLDEQRMVVCNDVFGVPCDDIDVIAPGLLKDIDDATTLLSRPVGALGAAPIASMDMTTEVVNMERHLTTGNGALLAVSAMRLSFSVESAWRQRSPIVGHPELITVAMKCLLTTDDVGVLGHIVSIVARLLLLKVIAADTWTHILQRAALDEPAPSSKFLTFVLPRLHKGAWDQFTARVFDVQLAVCDEDTEGVLCKSLDGLCRAATHGGLADVVAVVASNESKPMYLRMSALYLIGHIAALTPLVPIPWVVDIATTSFRLASDEALKSAAAAMLSTLAIALRLRAGGRGMVNDVDLEALVSTARHLSQYRSTSAVPNLRANLRTDEEVIRLHGDLIQQEIKTMSHEAFGDHESDETSSDVARLQALSKEAWKERDASFRAVSRMLR
jgi:hypothetical protein